MVRGVFLMDQFVASCQGGFCVVSHLMLPYASESLRCDAIKTLPFVLGTPFECPKSKIQSRRKHSAARAWGCSGCTSHRYDSSPSVQCRTTNRYQIALGRKRQVSRKDTTYWSEAELKESMKQVKRGVKCFKQDEASLIKRIQVTGRSIEDLHTVATGFERRDPSKGSKWPEDPSKIFTQ